MYHRAFDATAESKSRIFDENQAVVEGEFVGTHIGEFAGIPATHHKVRVPLCVVYDLDAGMIKRGRVYIELPCSCGSSARRQGRRPSPDRARSS